MITLDWWCALIESTKKDVHVAEVTASFKGGATVHIEEQSESMYTSIDKAADTLTGAMRRRRAKLVEKKTRKDRGVLSPEEIEELEALGDIEDSDADDEGPLL